MKRVIFVRHGETDSNLGLRMRGWSDDGLNERGKRQAELTAEHLQGLLPIDVIYTSTLPRSIETAEIIAKRLGVSVVSNADLKELNLGTLEGGSEGDLWRYFTQSAGVTENSAGQDIVFPEGEAVSAFLSRIARALASIAQAHPDQSVLIVSHGVATMVALGRWLEPNLMLWPKYRLDNCSITEVEFKPQPQLVRLNETAHLKSNVL